MKHAPCCPSRYSVHMSHSYSSHLFQLQTWTSHSTICMPQLTQHLVLIIEGVNLYCSTAAVKLDPYQIKPTHTTSSPPANIHRKLILAPHHMSTPSVTRHCAALSQAVKFSSSETKHPAQTCTFFSLPISNLFVYKADPSSRFIHNPTGNDPVFQQKWGISHP